MRSIVLGLLLAMAPLSSALSGEREIAAIESILQSDVVDTAMFAPQFLSAVPAAQLQTAVTQVRETIGPVTEIEARDEANYLVETATHKMHVQIMLDADGRIAGLMFAPSVAKSLSYDDLLGDMQALAPEFGLLVMRNGEMLHAVNADRPLAVGSAFKLGVLDALAKDIAAGRRDWSDVVRLEASDQSLPSGVLQTWPAGAPMTLHTLAGMMISISDNTATDALIRVVGREPVEAALGIAPVLTTRELFTLKATPDLQSRYVAGDLSERRTVLAEIAAMPLPAVVRAMTPYHAEMEWNLSTTKLCTLMDVVGDLDVMSINAGVARADDWGRVAFKGGSERGVLNLTTALTADDGTQYCVAATWNGPEPIDESAATSSYAGLLALLKRG